ncbi:MAG: hypothetical protein WBQ23_04865 [Bacteroidota bacterium]
MQTSVTLFVACMAIGAVLNGCTASSQNYSNSWGSIAFDTPIQFSPPADIGLNAVALVSPPESQSGAGSMEITLVSVPPDMAEGMENDNEMILGYLKSTFLATSKPGKKTAGRSFLTKTVEGETVSSTIPKPSELEYYLVPLSDGAMMLIALRWDSSVTTEDAAAVFAMIAETLKEIPRTE